MIVFSQLGRMGRLANGMFSIAGTIGIAVKSGQHFGFPKWINHDAKERFGTTEDIEIYKYFLHELPEMPNIQYTEYPYWWGYRDIHLPSGDWDLGGHMQSDKFFRHCMNLIRHYFTMKDEVDYPGRIAVHMRFGDYSRDPNGYHPCQSVDYYRTALEQVNGDIMLFSDDLNAASEIMAQLGVHYIPVDENYLDSFKIMKRCSHFITANSSFSLMAAILGPDPDKRIICPRNWFGPDVGLETADLYPENCLVI